jgi:hypothetical protein
MYTDENRSVKHCTPNLIVMRIRNWIFYSIELFEKNVKNKNISKN